MKEMFKLKLKRNSSKYIKYGTIILSIVAFIFVFVYLTKADFVVTQEFKVIDSTVGEFNQGDIMISALVDGEPSRQFPSQDDYVLDNVICTDSDNNNVEVKFQKSTWKIKELKTNKKTKCVFSFSSWNKHVYAYLYDSNNDGVGDTLKFNSTGVPQNDSNVKENYGDIFDDLYIDYNASDRPAWYNNLNITKVDIENKITPKYTSTWFSMLHNLEKINNLSNLDTSKVTTMERMFNKCYNLENIDVSTFDTGNVTNISCIFYRCEKFTYLDLNNWDTSKVTHMEQLFDGLYGIKVLRFENLDTSNVTTMAYMFRWNPLTTLDLTHFDTSKVESYDNMFYDTSNLTKIYVSSKWTLPLDSRMEVIN